MPILIVDDNPGVRRSIDEILRRNGWDTIVAGSAMEALATVLNYEGPIQLAIIDLIMPGIGGLDLANQLAMDRPSTKVLYISGHSGSIAVDGIRHCAPDAVLQKPFTATEFL